MLYSFLFAAFSSAVVLGQSTIIAVSGYLLLELESHSPFCLAFFLPKKRFPASRVLMLSTNVINSHLFVLSLVSKVLWVVLPHYQTCSVKKRNWREQNAVGDEWDKQAAIEASGCEQVDTACLCSSTGFIQNILSCVSSSCVSSSCDAEWRVWDAKNLSLLAWHSRRKQSSKLQWHTVITFVVLWVFLPLNARRMRTRNSL